MRHGLLHLLSIILAVTLPFTAAAHQVRPGYLDLRQVGAERWTVLWRLPILGVERSRIHPHFPSSCTATGETVTSVLEDAQSERMIVTCQGGLAGKRVGFDGLAGGSTDVLVRLARGDGSVQTALVTPSEPSFVATEATGSFDVAATYGVLGIDHILEGVDHLLFVLGLLLLVRSRWMLLKTITAFTVAHSLTLAAATLGLARVPQAPVEAVIALSILFLAAELARSRQGRTGLTRNYPWLVSFLFGLLHGFGFAGALREVGLPDRDIPLALLSFNVGVELGQLLFVGAVLTMLALLQRVIPRLPSWTAAVPAYAIGITAAFWCIARVAPML